MKSVPRSVALAVLLLVNFSAIAEEQKPLLASGGAASAIRPYVLYYEGPIEGSSNEIAKSIDGLLGDIDHSKVSSESVKKNIIGTNVYWLEMFVEAATEQTVEYLQNYIVAHAEFAVGNLKLALRPASQVVEVSSITGFGPDGTGKEVSWGSFTRLNRFSNVSAYNTRCMMDIGPTLAGGREDQILKLVPSLMSPADAYSFSSMLSGTAPFQYKMSRFNWNSHSYFAMEDGTYINRALSFNVDRKLGAQSAKSQTTRLLAPGYEAAGDTD
jgi:hypothetical protein